jgi:hypothetical protein
MLDDALKKKYNPLIEGEHGPQDLTLESKYGCMDPRNIRRSIQ